MPFSVHVCRAPYLGRCQAPKRQSLTHATSEEPFLQSFTVKTQRLGQSMRHRLALPKLATSPMPVKVALFNRSAELGDKTNIGRLERQCRLPQQTVQRSSSCLRLRYRLPESGPQDELAPARQAAWQPIFQHHGSTGARRNAGWSVRRSLLRSGRRARLLDHCAI